MVQAEGDFLIEGFEFRSGERLEALNLHYTTVGQPDTDGYGRINNAILILHGTGGGGSGFLRPQFAGQLFEPGQLLDAEKYYIILPDGIGHGQSSRPSETLKANFPRYGYHDMVIAQHRLLTEHLDIESLRLVMGTSMGGMQTWMWGYLYPKMMQALMPLASLPVEIAGRNRMIRRMIMDSIRLSPDYAEGMYETQPAGLRMAIHSLLIMVGAPHQWQTMAPTQAAADELFDDLVSYFLTLYDANDLYYAFNASHDYNPEPYLTEILAPLTAVNFSDDAVNPPELGILPREIGKVRNGRAITLPISEETHGHRSHSYPNLWLDHLAELLTRSA